MKTKNKKAISTLIAVTVAFSILVAFSATASAAVTTWYVDDDWQVGSMPYAEDIDGDNDFATILAAINAASDGDTIMVGDGTYTITGKLMIDKQGLTITGNVANPENVVVQYNPVANNLIFDMRASDVTVKGIKTTNGKSGFWFDQSGVTGCTISHCIVDTVNEYGIYMKNGGSGHTIEYTTISNTGQTYAGAPAVLIENSLDVTLNGNTLSSISDKGIYVRVCAASNTGERVEVTGNTLSGCNYPCVQVYQSPYTIVDGNTISSTNDKGINIIGPNANSAAERVELTNNIISGCPWGAILVTHDRYTYIHGNNIGPTGDKGITIGNGENINTADERIEVSDNTITGTKYPGIQVAWAVPYTYIYNNTLTGCNYFGGDGTGDWDYASIHVDENCDNTIVDRNDVSDGINGIQTWSDNCEITNNNIYDMGLTYATTKTTADGTYYNSGIIIGSNWLTNNIKPTGTTVTCNNIHDNYWGLYVRDYATLSPGDTSVLSVTAECNWWGDASGPDDDAEVINGTGDKISTNVDAKPWYATSTTTPSTEYVTVEESPTVRAYSDTIQGGIDAAVAGNTVTVAAGTYQENVEVNKQLTLIGDPSTPSNVVVDAQGTCTRPIKITADGCTLRGFKTINSESYYGSIGVWSNNNIIKDNIASDNSGSSGIFVYGSSYNTIENNNVSNNGNWGINLYSIWVGPGYIACENNTIKNNIANGNGQEGIGSGVYANNNTIEDNQVNGNTYAGIGLFRCSGNTIKDNTVNGNGAIGINIYGTSADPCTDHIIIGNTVNNNGGNANIELGGYCDNNTVENNTANNGQYGIRVSGNDNIIKNNTAHDNSPYDGMRLKGDNYTIEGNTCNSNEGRGIWLGGSEVTNSIVRNNTLNDNDVGILLWTCHNSNLTGNTINNNTMYGIEVASNSPDNLINFNNIVGNGFYGVINKGTTEVDATCNWWGDDSGPSGEGPGTGDAVSTNVDYNPWIGITELSGPTEPVKINAPVSVGYSFTCGMLPATLEWGDGNSDSLEVNSGSVPHTYSDAGVYTVTLTIEDCCDRSYSREFRYAVVYDPTAGFVTGGGWIDSPAGAYTLDLLLTGKANFGFVSKYKKGQTTPTATGNTEFQFKAGDLNFHSDSYEWLVIAGHKAMYKGTGTIKGYDGDYGFMLSAIDEKLTPSTDVDMFRIKIWDKDNDDGIVYDNQMGYLDDADLTTAIAGGQIVIHKAKGK